MIAVLVLKHTTYGVLKKAKKSERQAKFFFLHFKGRTQLCAKNGDVIDMIQEPRSGTKCPSYHVTGQKGIDVILQTWKKCCLIVIQYFWGHKKPFIMWSRAWSWCL